MRINDPKKRKTLLSIGKEPPRAVRELLTIRGDSRNIKEDFDAFSSSDKALKLMKKKGAALFISSMPDSSVTVGRMFDGELLELVKFRVRSALSSQDFPTLPPELYVKYFLVVQNIENKRVENMLVDLLHQPSSKVNIDAMKYAWIVNQTGKIITIKFARVLNDSSVEDIGPLLELETEKEFYCGDDLHTRAFSCARPKARKNVSSNVFKDKVGRIFVDKQDLKDINLKKSRAYRSG